MPADSGCANPLLLQWLEEWLQNARERNSKGVQTYKKAYDSMKACPVTFEHPSEAQQLNGLGPKLCDRLTEKLKEHCIENGLQMPLVHRPSQKRPSSEATEAVPSKRARRPKPYVPFFRSGAYAIIVALSSAGEEASRVYSKPEVIELAQCHCDSSFTAPSDPTKFYTAWNSMKTLMEKDLIFERGRPLRKYGLTEDGWEVARRIRNASQVNRDLLQVDQVPSTKARTTGSSMALNQEPHNHHDNISSQSKTRNPPQSSRQRSTQVSTRLDSWEESSTSSENDGFVQLSSSPPRNFDGGPPTLEAGTRIHNATERIRPEAISGQAPHSTSAAGQTDVPPSFQPFFLQPSEFDVHLVLDTREIRAKQDRDYIQEELTRKGVKPIMRSLDLGDALWVAKRKGSNTLGSESENDEVVLDWVVERKRLDDLVGSIKDGRFHEQKFRLRRSGMKNVIYIIEEITMSAESLSKYQEAVESAIASTQIVNGYFVKMTAKVDDTIRYLARMTALLKSIYERRTLSIIPTSVLTTENHLPLLAHLGKTEPTTDYYITYSAFASLASKTELLTMRDVFLKMLMCIKGLTGERALEIQKKWITPRHLIEAFEKCGKGETGRAQQESMLMEELSNLVGRRKIGKALSAKVAEVWGFCKPNQ